MQENAAKTAAEWVLVARSVAQMPGGEVQAMRCTARAAVLAQSVEDWIALARVWAQDFGDVEMARHCMGKAESLGEDHNEWVQVANACSELGYDEIAERCQEFAVILEPQEAIYTPLLITTDESQMSRVLGLYVAVSDQLREGNPEQALFIISHAETVARSSLDWTSIAKVWMSEFFDKSNAYRCISQAETIAEDSSDWIVIAKSWASILHDKNSAIRCLKQAESVIAFSSNWTQIAITWMDLFHDKSNAFRCLEEAAHLAWQPSDWTNIAQGWLDVFCDRQRAAMFAERFESTMVMYPSAYDWDTLAKFWTRLGYLEKARRAWQEAQVAEQTQRF